MVEHGSLIRRLPRQARGRAICLGREAHVCGYLDSRVNYVVMKFFPGVLLIVGGWDQVRKGFVEGFGHRDGFLPLRFFKFWDLGEGSQGLGSPVPNRFDICKKCLAFSPSKLIQECWR